MSFYNTKPFWISGAFCALAFLFLFMIRLDLFDRIFLRPRTLSLSSIGDVKARQTWMNIFQNERKIGFSHTRFSIEATGYRLQETVFMRINTMGMVQDINLVTEGRLNPDFTLADLSFEISSGRFRFNVKGSVSDTLFRVETLSSGNRRKVEIPLKKKPYIFAGIIDAVVAAGLKPGDKFVFDIFDPSTMDQQAVHVEVIGPEDVQVMGSRQNATKISLSFKGATQLAWIGESGDVLKEKGLLGIRLEKTSRKNALSDLALESSRDLTKAASVASNRTLENLDQRSVLKVEIAGIPLNHAQLDGGRQKLEGNVLTIQKEDLADLPRELSEGEFTALERIFLEPSPFIQSDHHKIKDLSEHIIGNGSQLTPMEKTGKLVDWVHEHIEKRPVLSLPDALSTLENRMGDCNEHAVLLAALARAAGIPSRVEAGLVYLKGRFYYHAWNRMYLGPDRWITADSLFGQLPADVSHIRFATGSQQQLDLMGIIGRVKLEVLD